MIAQPFRLVVEHIMDRSGSRPESDTQEMTPLERQQTVSGRTFITSGENLMH
jgi:hypothetical protein